MSNARQMFLVDDNEGEITQAPRPDVIVLDLDMPRKDGIETLRKISTDSRLVDLSLVIFSSSTASSDQLRAELYKADDYIMKPLILKEFNHAIALIEVQWCKPQHRLNGELA